MEKWILGYDLLDFSSRFFLDAKSIKYYKIHLKFMYIFNRLFNITHYYYYSKYHFFSVNLIDISLIPFPKSLETHFIFFK